jgi:peptidoglycan/LPS O-acetylase OafA/YrhL
MGGVLIAPVQQQPDAISIFAKLLLCAVNGHMAVVLFFVLSGFVLRLSLDRLTNQPASQIILNFTVRRLFRLYPAMLFCMAFFFSISAGWGFAGLPPVPGIPAPDAFSALQNALLTNITWHGASQTIQAEVLAVPFILAFYFTKRWLGEIGLSLCLCYCLLSYEIPAMVIVPYMPETLAAMAIGMIAANARSIFTSTPPWTLFGIVTALFLSLVFFGLGSPVAELARIVLAALLIGGCFYAAPSSAMIRLLKNRSIQFFGRTSYSLYLLNVPVFIMLAPLARWLIYPTSGLLAGVALGLAAFLVTLPLAALSERRVERGGIWLGDRILKSRHSPASPSAIEYVSA